jgi:hypothetical protein
MTMMFGVAGAAANSPGLATNINTSEKTSRFMAVEDVDMGSAMLNYHDPLTQGMFRTVGCGSLV